MDLEELRRQIESGELILDDNSSEVIEETVISDLLGNDYTYRIEHGWNIVSAMKCDRSWNSFTRKILEYIHEQGYSEEELEKILEGIDTQHLHWDWFAKSLKYTGKEYEWFFLLVDDEPQGACLIYHPKESVIDSESIFYIEYLLVAPWNKENPLSDRKFKGIGPKLMCCSLNHAVNKLGLVYGFCLHSLPQSIDFYTKMGMINFSHNDKENLPYFEMPRNLSMELVGAR